MHKGLGRVVGVSAVLGLVALGSVVVDHDAPETAPSPVALAFQPDGQGWRGSSARHEARYEAGALSVTGAAGGAQVRFGPTVIRRGGLELSQGDAIAGRADDGHLDVTRGRVRESLRNGERGLEQAWHFDAPPEGEGALEVRIPVEGELVSSGPDGLRLARGGQRVTYGHATWIDATGARRAVPAEWLEGAIVLRVPGETLAQATYPAVLDPLISADFDLVPPALFQPPTPEGALPAVAWNGSLYLVAWFNDQPRRLLARRVSATGTPLEFLPIELPSVTTADVQVAVASNGSDFLLAWIDAPALKVARVDADGQVLGTTTVHSGFTVGTPVLAWNGTHYLVAWEEGQVGRLRMLRLSSTGQPLDAAGGVALTTGTTAQTNPAIASNGADFFVTWNEQGTSSGWDVYGVQVTSGGMPGTPVAIATTSANEWQPSVAWNDSYLVTWHDTAPSRTVSGRRFTATGAVNMNGPFTIATGAANARATASGSGFFVTWTDVSTTPSALFGTPIGLSDSVAPAVSFGAEDARRARQSRGRLAGGLGRPGCDRGAAAEPFERARRDVRLPRQQLGHSDRSVDGLRRNELLRGLA